MCNIYIEMIILWFNSLSRIYIACNDILRKFNGYKSILNFYFIYNCFDLGEGIFWSFIKAKPYMKYRYMQYLIRRQLKTSNYGIS